MSKLLQIDLNLAKNDKKWQENPNYLAIKKITKENLEKKTGQIEAGTPLKKVEKQGDKNSNVLSFGKYRGQTKDYVRENDPSYFAWAKENIKGF
jgi:hypothetical protein